MPIQSSISSDEKAKVKGALSQSSKILAVTPARVYYAHPDPQSWSYSGLQGALAFVKDSGSDVPYLRLVDLQGTRGTIWEHELYEGLQFNNDRPYFHSFAGDECMIGLVYFDECEAATLLKKVNSRKKSTSKTKSLKKSKKGGSKDDRSLISGPQSDLSMHISHMGWDAEKDFTSSSVDPSWTNFLNQLQNLGIDKNVITENTDFIEGFVMGVQSQNSGPETVKIAGAVRPSPSSGSAKKRPAHPKAPSRAAYAQKDSEPESAAPPLPRARNAAAAAPPPPSVRAPAAPPPPPAGAPAPALSIPAPRPGRAALLDSIQGKGVHTLRKTSAVAEAKSPKKSKKGGSKVDRSLLSGPPTDSFVHVSHMRWDAEKGFTSSNVDPSWTNFLNQLQNHGIDKNVIAENMDFIKDFIKGTQTRSSRPTSVKMAGAVKLSPSGGSAKKRQPSGHCRVIGTAA